MSKPTLDSADYSDHGAPEPYMQTMFHFTLVIFLCIFAVAMGGAAEYFVAPDGSDENDGLTREDAFASVQRGVDALEPGDTLTLLPGEYFGGFRREGLGGPDGDTIIRAEIPGTAIIHGDVPGPEFEKVDGYRFVYGADFETEAFVVNELDTLTVLEQVPNLDELEFSPGRFYQDLEAGKLYISTSDLRSAHEHHYSIGLTGTHGIYLREPERVIIEGLAVTGFNNSGLLPWGESTDGATWGIYLQNGRHCVIRDCYAYFNGRGIVISSASESSGDGLIDNCVAWANSSQYGGPYGGLSLHQPRRDILRNSVAFRNGHKGVNIRVAGDAARRGESALSRLLNNVSWGNPIDLRIKAASSGHIAERNVAMNSVEGFESLHNLLGGGRGAGSDRLASEDTIMLSAEPELDPLAEFAAPDHFDYRLQPGSRFHGTGPDGQDRGPFPYQANIYYLAPEGDDEADGLSSVTPWKSLAHAADMLKAGDTLYIEPGFYEEPLEWSGLRGEPDQPIAIKSRRLKAVVLGGPVTLKDVRHVAFERLNFAGPVTVEESQSVEFINNRFTAPEVSLVVCEVDGLRLTHCEFTGFKKGAIELTKSSQVFLSGNLFDNREGPALLLDGVAALFYSDYNGYADEETLWQVEGETINLTGLPETFDRNARIGAPEFEVENGVARLTNPHDFAIGGPTGTPLGVYLPQVRYATPPLHVEEPVVHSTTATTANFEWWASERESFVVHWGETLEEMESRRLTPVNAYHPPAAPDQFNTFSLTGLTPGTTYYFRLTQNGNDFGQLTFTTLEEDPAPRTLFVSMNGADTNDGQTVETALRTIARAADLARPGDTVLISGGTYQERVRIRATGDATRPITFRPVQGEKVVMDGSGGNLPSAFTISNKSHIDLDGFYFQNFRRMGTRGIVNIHRGGDIRITRCFADGRSRGTHPELVTAGATENLLVKNCVLNGGWGFVAIGNSPGLRIENNVVLRVSITTIGLGGVMRDTVISGNIITDNLAVKRFAALAPRGGDHIALTDNCFFLRWPEEERGVFGSDHDPLDQQTRKDGNLVANPRFAVVKEDPELAGSETFTDNILGLIDDFPDAFTTNPELVGRGIGLIPADFADFHFHRPPASREDE